MVNPSLNLRLVCFNSVFINSIGDIAPQKAIREKLQCKSFKWFMDNVAYDLLKKFPLPSDNKVWGEVCSFYFNLFVFAFYFSALNLRLKKSTVFLLNNNLFVVLSFLMLNMISS